MDGVEGFLVPIRSPQAIYERLVQIADDRELQRRMSEAAIARVARNQGWTAYGENYSQFLQKLIQG
nr:hypothetical protein [Acidisarcina polymorpha]